MSAAVREHLLRDQTEELKIKGGARVKAAVSATKTCLKHLRFDQVGQCVGQCVGTFASAVTQCVYATTHPKCLASARCPIRNDHPLLHTTPHANADMLSQWVVMLPAPACVHFKLEPNFNAHEGPKDIWVGRMWHLRRIRWLQYCATRRYSTLVSPWRAHQLKKQFARGTKDARVLEKVQLMTRGWFVRHRSKPLFLSELVGLNVRSVVIYMHGSGGLTWANPRLMRTACGFGSVVIAPDHMSSAEWRARKLKPLHRAGDDTSYWNNSLFYAGKKKQLGQSLDFCTSAEGVLTSPSYYKQLYQKVFEVRAAELHFVLKRMPPAAKMMGVVLFGTSEGAMTVYRFDDKPYAQLITGRIINAFAGEFCYFTPSREAAQLGGQIDVPTLNMIGTHDEYFGPATAKMGSKVTPRWDGSISAKVAAHRPPYGRAIGWGDPPTGNAFASFEKQGLSKALVATFVYAEHDATLKADNSIRDVLLQFLRAPSRCTSLPDAWATTPHLERTTKLKQRRPAAGTKAGQTPEVVWVEIAASQDSHQIASTVDYSTYQKLAAAWARHQQLTSSVAAMDEQLKTTTKSRRGYV